MDSRAGFAPSDRAVRQLTSTTRRTAGRGGRAAEVRPLTVIAGYAELHPWIIEGTLPGGGIVEAEPAGAVEAFLGVDGTPLKAA